MHRERKIISRKDVLIIAIHLKKSMLLAFCDNCANKHEFVRMLRKLPLIHAEMTSLVKTIQKGVLIRFGQRLPLCIKAKSWCSFGGKMQNLIKAQNLDKIIMFHAPLT